MNSTPLNGKRISLIPVSEEHFEHLFEWRNNTKDLMLWSSVRSIIPKHEYWQELKSDYSNGLIRLVVVDKNSNTPIGQVFSYNYNNTNNNLFIGIYIIPDKRKLYYGIEALTVFVTYLFSYFSLHKIYFEIFEYNTHSKELARKSGFKEEGVFKDHFLFNGKYWSLFRFAFYASDLKRMSKFVERFIEKTEV